MQSENQSPWKTSPTALFHLRISFYLRSTYRQHETLLSLRMTETDSDDPLSDPESSVKDDADRQSYQFPLTERTCAGRRANATACPKLAETPCPKCLLVAVRLKAEHGCLRRTPIDSSSTVAPCAGNAIGLNTKQNASRAAPASCPRKFPRPSTLRLTTSELSGHAIPLRTSSI